MHSKLLRVGSGFVGAPSGQVGYTYGSERTGGEPYSVPGKGAYSVQPVQRLRHGLQAGHRGWPSRGVGWA